MIKIFIDGQAGTTGLELEKNIEALAKTTPLELLKIAPALRKDQAERKKYLNAADVVFLCLPDVAAIDAVSLIDNPEVVVIDASTAHRTHPLWTYGFPELSKAHHQALTSSNRIAVPGCHATGFIALVHPLIQSGAIQKSDLLVCHSLTGYSGGGKEMIAQYEAEDQTASAAWMYALNLNHKHLPEMMHTTGLVSPPLFIPVVVPVHRGMLIQIPLMASAEQLHAQLDAYYKHTPTIRVSRLNVQPHLNIEGALPLDGLEIYVFGNDTQAVLVAKLDNLGKGASGAALQCMKVRFGL